MSEAAKTKKDKILNIARQDPFLKVEEIAAKVGTTPRYVRTILSDAKISLMQLRRSYARRMEERLGIDAGSEGRGAAGAPAVVRGIRGLDVNEIRVCKVKQPEWAKQLRVPDDESLLMVTRVRATDGEAGVCQSGGDYRRPQPVRRQSASGQPPAGTPGPGAPRGY